jgi:predicted RNase H-like HicB family nuclease
MFRTCRAVSRPPVSAVEEEIRIAMLLHIEGLRDDGLPTPDPSTQAAYLKA